MGAKDLIWALIGPVLDFVKSILGIAGSIEDWLSDLLNSVLPRYAGKPLLRLLGAIETAIADYFAAQYPIYELEDPYPILQAGGGLIPVKIPIRNLTASINSKEMVILAEVG